MTLGLCLLLGAGCGGAADGGSDAGTAGGVDTSGGDGSPADGDDTTAADVGGATMVADDEGDTTGATPIPGDTSGAESTGDPPPMGDVWVDAEGTVIGYYRVVVDDSDDAVEGLVDFDDVTWGVSPEHTSVAAIDWFGRAFYESVDCAGPVYISEPNGSYGTFRDGIVASALGPDFEELLFVVPPGTARVPIEFASWVDWTYGCLDFEVGIYDNAPVDFYAEADLQFVERPAFVPPLTIEHH